MKQSRLLGQHCRLTLLKAYSTKWNVRFSYTSRSVEKLSLLGHPPLYYKPTLVNVYISVQVYEYKMVELIESLFIINTSKQFGMCTTFLHRFMSIKRCVIVSWDHSLLVLTSAVTRYITIAVCRYTDRYDILKNYVHFHLTHVKNFRSNSEFVPNKKYIMITSHLTYLAEAHANTDNRWRSQQEIFRVEFKMAAFSTETWINNPIRYVHLGIVKYVVLNFQIVIFWQIELQQNKIIYCGLRWPRFIRSASC